MYAQLHGDLGAPGGIVSAQSLRGGARAPHFAVGHTEAPSKNQELIKIPSPPGDSPRLKTLGFLESSPSSSEGSQATPESDLWQKFAE